MGKKYLDTKEGSLEQSVLGVWQTAIEEGETRVDGRTKAYKEHRAKLEAARLRREKLVGGQKKLDKDKDGDIDGKDFAMLRKSKNKDKKEEVQIDELIGAVPAAVGGYVAGKIMSGKKHKKVKKEDDQIDELIGAVPAAIAGYALGKENVKKKHGIKSKVIKAKKEEVELDEGKMRDLSIKIDDIVAKMKKDKNMKGFADKFKKDAMKSMDIEKSLEKVLPDYIAGKEIQKLMGESYEIGTDKYRKHTEDVTPGEDGEWVEAVNAKNISMREALAKVWGVDEGKSPFKKEDKKGDKTLTGKKVASVDVNPTIKEKTK